jgi:hypothetical protein
METRIIRPSRRASVGAKGIGAAPLRRSPKSDSHRSLSAGKRGGAIYISLLRRCVGGGAMTKDLAETALYDAAPAIANAVYSAMGKRVHLLIG